jgi:hypothetical protein
LRRTAICHLRQPSLLARICRGLPPRRRFGDPMLELRPTGRAHRYQAGRRFFAGLRDAA